MVTNELFLACVLARGGEREGASQWWNVQGPHSPSRTLSVSKLRIYNCPVQLHCMQMISQYVNTSCMSKGMTKRYRSSSREDGFQSIACSMYRQKVNRMHVAYSSWGGEGAGANPALSVCPPVCLAWNRLLGSQHCFLVFIFIVTFPIISQFLSLQRRRAHVFRTSQNSLPSILFFFISSSIMKTMLLL